MLRNPQQVFDFMSTTLKVGGCRIIPFRFGLEGMSNNELTYAVAGAGGLRVQVLGERLRTYSLVSVHWSLLSSLECKIDTNAGSPLGLRQRSAPRLSRGQQLTFSADLYWS